MHVTFQRPAVVELQHQAPQAQLRGGDSRLTRESKDHDESAVPDIATCSLGALFASPAVLGLSGVDAALPSTSPLCVASGTVESEQELEAAEVSRRLKVTLRSRCAASMERPARLLAHLRRGATPSVGSTSGGGGGATEAIASCFVPMVGRVGRAGGGGGGQTDGELRSTPTLASLRESLTLGLGLIERWARAEEVSSRASVTAKSPKQQQMQTAKALQEVVTAFEDCLKLLEVMPRPRLKEELPSLLGVSAITGSSSLEPQLQTRFTRFLHDVVGKIRGLKPGGFLLLPAGWLRAHVSDQDVAVSKGDDSGHCVLLVLVRAAAAMGVGEFTLSVVNTGISEGLCYHPLRASGSAPRPEMPLRQCPLVITDIPAARVTSTAFWYMLYRQIVYPASDNGPQLLYDTLLPALNQKPLSANMAATEGPLSWTEFQPPSPVADNTFALAMQRAAQFCLRAAGLNAEAAAWSAVRMRQELAAASREALAAAPATFGNLALLRSSCSVVARAAAEHADRHLGDETQAREADLVKLRQLLECLDSEAHAHELKLGASESGGARSSRPPRCPAEEITGIGAANANTAKLTTWFGGLERVLVHEDVERLKGPVRPPRVAISVGTSSLPAAVGDLIEAAECCRLASGLLTMLANQQDQIPQSALTRFALVTHLLVRVLPMPLPMLHGRAQDDCFWMRGTMTPETRTDLLRHLRLIACHFASVCFTLRGHRETDGARVVVAAALTAVMDALMRRPLGGPLSGSLVALHYSGQAEGPTSPFGLAPGTYRMASESLLLAAPELHTVRSVTLDYFDSIHRIIDSKHVVFRFDESPGCSEGDRHLVGQVGLNLGIDVSVEEVPKLLAGERPELVELFPELVWFRDVVFLWKLLLLPAANCPAQRPWRAADASLRWTWSKDKFVVEGFGGMRLKPHTVGSGGGLFSNVARWLNFRSSSADEGDSGTRRASVEALTNDCEKAQTEEDVLFIQNVPSFGGMLSASDSELLLSYLTAPYLRVPLLLGFFTDRDRVTLLRDPKLQAVLDAALFEPGPWRSLSDTAIGPPELIPAPTREHLGTPAGLLVNELRHSPKVVLEAVLCMLRVAVDKDVGRPDTSNEGLILYLVRLAVRVESFLLFLLGHVQQGSSDTHQLVNLSGSHVRRILGCTGDEANTLASYLTSALMRLRKVLRADVLRMLLGWAKFAARNGDTLLHMACRAHAHLALLSKNIPDDEFGVDEVTVLLSAQLFLSANHRWSIEREPGALNWLGVCEIELFDVFEAKRGLIIKYLRNNRAQANGVLQQAERAVTDKGATGQANSADGEHWVELPRNPGDFVPVQEAPPDGWANAKPQETYRTWLLRVTRGPPDTARRISVNLGRYGMKCEGLELLPTWATCCGDYIAAFGRCDVHCVDREVAEFRIWKDVIGHGHSVQLWKRDTRGLEADVPTSAYLASKRAYRPEACHGASSWLQEVFEPVRLTAPPLTHLAFYMKGEGSEANNNEVWMIAVAKAQGSEGEMSQVKEIRVQRSPPLVEIYDVTEHGRRFYRTLAFTSDATWSFHAPPTGELFVHMPPAGGWCLAAGRADAVREPADSVIVMRNVVECFGRQTYISDLFLRGQLPDALLEKYHFWRCEDGGVPRFLVGDERILSDVPSRLYVKLAQDKGLIATVERRKLRLPQCVAPGGVASHQLQEEDGAQPEVLVNLQRGLLGIARVLVRLDNLSHVLVWTDHGSQGGVLRAELPRLRLSFSRRDQHLYCDQHAGYWVHEKECPAAVEQLVSQWGGGAVILENKAGKLLVLVSAISEPLRPAVDPGMDMMPTQVVLRRGKATWLANLAEGSRHYCYPVHNSGIFSFAPTQAASLYLLLCRMLTWQFADVSGMASAVSEIANDEEEQIWDRLSQFAAETYHAEGVACCLRLTLAALPYQCFANSSVAVGRRWDTRRLLLEYVRKRHLVSADCALSVDQELALLNFNAAQEPCTLHPELAARHAVLSWLANQAAVDGPDTVDVQVVLGTHCEDAGFDRITDKTFTNETGIIERISAAVNDVAYSRPEQPRMQGIEALCFLDSLFRGAGNMTPNAQFPMIYELFTETLVVDVNSGDDGSFLASILLRMVARSGSKGVGLSVLRALELNPSVRGQMPKWGSNDLKWSFGIAGFTFDRDSTSKLLEAAAHKLRSLQPSLKWPRGFAQPESAPSTIALSVRDASHLRYWSRPLTNDALCAARDFPGHFSEDFAGQPLARLAKQHLQADRTRQGFPPGAERVKTVLEQLVSRGGTGQAVMKRLLDDLQRSTQSQTGRSTYGPLEKIESRTNALASEILKQRKEDIDVADAALRSIVTTVNGGDALTWLRRLGGHLSHVTFNQLVALLLAQEPAATRALQRISPTLGADLAAMKDESKTAVTCVASISTVSGLLTEVAHILFRVVRVGQASRVQEALEELRLERLRGAPGHDLALRARVVGDHLGASRHFVRVQKGGAKQRVRTFDPRFLVFEFLFDVMLREPQIRILNTFVGHADAGRSVCHQMIMGAGKTTVVAPLLVVLLADGQRLACVCVPPALLDMSRTIMMERFSSPALPRPVLVLRFRRHLAVTPALRGRIEAARRARAAVVAAPASLKSLLLRHIELLHNLQELRIARFHANIQSSENAAHASTQRTPPKQNSWLQLPAWLVGGDSGTGQCSTVANGSEFATGVMSPEEIAKSQECMLCGEVLSVLHKGALVLDEVDLILDPLRSELNWPTGRKVPLELAEASAPEVASSRSKHRDGLRYRLPFHLLDAVFAASSVASGGAAYNADVSSVATSDCAERRDAQATLAALAQAMEVGRFGLKLQFTPHMVLLSQEFYVQELLPHLATWAVYFLEAYVEGAANEAELKSLILEGARVGVPREAAEKKSSKMSPLLLQLVRLTIHWLHNLLPYLLSKVHRVSYGLLLDDDLRRANTDQCASPSRRFLAVPFVGKDTPSACSEFSNPDVTIGFSILAYRLGGLRDADIQSLLKVLIGDMRMENTVRYHRRTACKEYVAMVVRAGGRVRGFSEDGRWLEDLLEEELRRHQAALAEARNQLKVVCADTSPGQYQRWELWPLELVDLADAEQFATIRSVLRESPLAVRYLLEHHSFPSGTLLRHERQFSASGQELAGPQLFGFCLGFSGTPNDLLPRSLGSCVYAPGDDGAVVATLSDAEAVSVLELAAWSPTGILDVVAKLKAPAPHGSMQQMPKYHALIDAGALVTGMTNRDVAEYLLKQGLEGFDGVVFLNEKDERVVLERDGFRVVDLAQSGLALERRFTFYDHIHTTGMDIRQPLACVAALTLSKDMSFRDYAQGAYRMRGFGQGQRIELLAVPEVMALVHKTLACLDVAVPAVSASKKFCTAAGGGVGGLDAVAATRAAELVELKKKTPQTWHQRIIVDILAWVLVNGATLEERKRQFLKQQDLRDIWRRAAAAWLEAPPAEIGPWLELGRTRAAIAELCTTLDFAIPSADGQDGGLKARLVREIGIRSQTQIHDSVWQDESQRSRAIEEARRLVGSLHDGRAPEAANATAVSAVPTAAADVPGDESSSFALSSEQVQEQEQEQEQHIEDVRDEEIEFEEEADKGEAPIDREYARDGEAAVPWPLKSLLAQPYAASRTEGVSAVVPPPFYPLAEFSVNKGMLGQSCTPLEGLPNFAMLSENYYRRSWRLSSVRRLKNVICFLEWVPDVSQLKRLEAPPGVASLSAEQRARLREVFKLYGRGDNECIDGHEVLLLFRSLDLDLEGQAVASNFANRRLSLEQIEQEVSSYAFYKMQQGRFFVALSLEEAEHLRASLHLLRHAAVRGSSSNGCWPTNCGFALRCLGNKEAGLNDSLLDVCGPVLESAELRYQLEAAEQLFRFVNSAENFQARELNILMRTLQLTKVEHRLPWWLDLRSCRRRAQMQWQRLPVAKAFAPDEAIADIATKALLSRVRWSLAMQGLRPVDAFRLIDTARTGGFKREEFADGLERMGVKRQQTSGNNNFPRWAAQVDALFRLLDKDGNGIIDPEEFKMEMELDAADWECIPNFARRRPAKANAAAADRGRPAAAVATGGQLPIAAVTAAAVAATAAAVGGSPSAIAAAAVAMTAAPDPPQTLTPAMCVKSAAGRFKLKWQQHKAFSPIWGSAGIDKSSMDGPLSFWAPEKLIPKGKLRGCKKGSNAVKERLALGHYAVPALGAPVGVSLLEVTDVRETGLFARHKRDNLNRFLETFCPHPVSYRLSWTQQSARPLFIWEPIPPGAEFVALGMVVTTDAKSPPLEEVRCVPRPWAPAQPAKTCATPLRQWKNLEVNAEFSPAYFWPEGNGTGVGSRFRLTASAHAPREVRSMDAAKFFASLSN